MSRLALGIAEDKPNTDTYAPPRPAVSALPKQADAGPASGFSSDGEDSDTEVDLPFEGRHVLEIYGLSARVPDFQLERQTQQLSDSKLPPVIRYFQ